MNINLRDLLMSPKEVCPKLIACVPNVFNGNKPIKRDFSYILEGIFSPVFHKENLNNAKHYFTFRLLAVFCTSNSSHARDIPMLCLILKSFSLGGGVEKNTPVYRVFAYFLIGIFLFFIRRIFERNFVMTNSISLETQLSHKGCAPSLPFTVSHLAKPKERLAFLWQVAFTGGLQYIEMVITSPVVQRRPDVRALFRGHGLPPDGAVGWQVKALVLYYPKYLIKCINAIWTSQAKTAVHSKKTEKARTVADYVLFRVARNYFYAINFEHYQIFEHFCDLVAPVSEKPGSIRKQKVVNSMCWA